MNYILVKENRVQIPESSGVWGLGRDFWIPWVPAATVVFLIPSTIRTSTLKFFTAWSTVKCLLLSCIYTTMRILCNPETPTNKQANF